MRPLVSMSGRPGALSPTRRRRSLLACRLANREYEQEHTDGDKSTDGVRMDRGAPAGNGGATLTAPGWRHLHAPPVDGAGKPGTPPARPPPPFPVGVPSKLLAPHFYGIGALI